MAFLRPPYTKKCHFRDPPIQQNGIFKTPLYNKFSHFDPPIQKWPKFDPPIQKMAKILPPYTKNAKILPPIQFFYPLYKKITPIQKNLPPIQNTSKSAIITALLACHATSIHVMNMLTYLLPYHVMCISLSQY